MTRVHRLEHVERLTAARLTDDDPVGSHAQGVAHEVTDGDRTLALEIGRPVLHAQHVHLVEPELGGILDRDDALVVRDEARTTR